MVRYDLQLSRKGVEFSGKILGQQSLAEEIEQLNLLDRVPADARRPKVFPPHVGLAEYEVEDLSYFLTSVTADIFKKLLSPIYRSAYYLPADRTGVMHSHQVVVSALVQNATTAGLEPSVGVPLLSGVLADFLSQLIEMSGGQGHLRSKSRSGASGMSEVLALDLEHKVLKGVVRMDDSGSGYPSFDYQPHDWNEPLPLMRASSMVSELAPVVLYLRHLVEPGDVLIIEEPESHFASGYAGGVHAAACGAGAGWDSGDCDHTQRVGAARVGQSGARVEAPQRRASGYRRRRTWRWSPIRWARGCLRLGKTAKAPRLARSSWTTSPASIRLTLRTWPRRCTTIGRKFSAGLGKLSERTRPKGPRQRGQPVCRHADSQRGL